MFLSTPLTHRPFLLPFTPETSQSSYWSCWPRSRLVQNCDVMRYYYFMILKDQCWVISSMIYGDCCQICYSLTLDLSDRNQPNLVNLSLPQILGFREQNNVFRGRVGPTLKYTYMHLHSTVCISSEQVWILKNSKLSLKVSKTGFLACSRNFSSTILFIYLFLMIVYLVTVTV